MAALKRTQPSIAALRLFCSTPTEPTSISIRTARTLIKSEPDPEKIAQIFQKSSESRRFHHDRTIFDLSVRRLSDLNRPDLIERILEPQLKPSTPNQPGSSDPKTDGFLTRILMLYARAGMLDQAVRTFHRVEELGCVRTEKSFSALLTAFLENKRFDKVHECFAEMPRDLGIRLTAFSYNLVMRAFCEEKKIDSALSLLGEMESIGISPNVVSYNTLLSGLLNNIITNNNNDKYNDKFDGILKEMIEKGISFDVVTYNHMILRYVRNKDSSKAKELLDEMIGKGIKPNSGSFNAIVTGFCGEGDLENAMEVFERLDPPNSIAYFAIIKALVEKGDVELGLELCRKSLEKKWIPPFATIVSLVDGLVKISKVEEAREIVKDMKNKFSASATEAWMKIEGGLPVEMGA